MVPGANIGDEYAVFEAVHGSAPDIAGLNVANPLALIMSGVMMLNHIADKEEGFGYMKKSAEKIKKAYEMALSDGETTRDLGGTLKTSDFARVLVRNVLKI